jgi:hypothetical protein
MIRSVIQPDGDYIIKITKEASNQPGLWQDHLAEVQSRIDAVWGLKIVVNYGLLVPGAIVIWNIWRDVIGLWEEILTKVLISLIIGVIIWLSRHLLTSAFRVYIRRLIKKQSIS